MRYVLAILKEIGVQISFGIVIGTSTLISSWYFGYKQVVQLSNILFIGSAMLLFFGPIIFRPKGIGFGPARGSPSIKFEPPDDESLVGLPEEEQKKYLSLDFYIVLIRCYGIGATMLFYSVIFYYLFRR